MDTQPNLGYGKPTEATVDQVNQWMRSQHGFREEQVKPYNFSLAPFLANKKSVQQGLLTSETYSYEKETKTPVKFFLLADSGWSANSRPWRAAIDLISAMLARMRS